MRHGLALALSLALLASPALPQGDPATLARAAAGQLEAAQQALAASDRARDRVKALTQTIRAYENGLVALRAALRRASIREATLTRAFESKRDEVSRLLGVLQSIETSPAPLLMLHPAGPIGTARSGMIVSDITPALQREAEKLRAELQEIALLRALQETAAETLETGLSGAQDARTELSLAISNRTDLPRRYLADPEALNALVKGSETLQAFAKGLADLPEAAQDLPDLPDFTTARGALPLPVQGTVLRRPGEADAAGIRRPGLVIATPPRALVTTPWSATIRYRGPLLDYGNVMVLEPSDVYLIVLAGLAEVYGEVGEVLPAGAPVGLMGGNAPDANTILARATEGGGEDRPETLYMELREGDDPVDPAIWFVYD